MNIEFRQVVNYTPGRYYNGINYPILAFVLHIAEGSKEGAWAWFNNPASQVSAHYIVGADRKIIQCVKLEDTAYHCGGDANGTWDFCGQQRVNANPYTIGIEMEGFTGKVSPETVDESSWLVAQLYVDTWLPELNRQRGIGHCEINMVSRALCPGINMDDFVALCWEKVRILKPEPMPAKVEQDSLYRVFKDDVQKGAYEVIDNALDSFIDNDANKVTFQGSDLTITFTNEMNKLQQELDAEKLSKENMQKTIDNLTQANYELTQVVRPLPTLDELAVEASATKLLTLFIKKLFTKNEEPT